MLKMKFQDVAALTPDTLDDALARKMINRESGTCELKSDGLDCWVFYSYVKYADWTIAIVVPETIIYYKGNLLATIILAVMFIGLVFIYILCHEYIKKGMKPLTRFVMAARQVAEGDFDVA